MAVCGDVSFMLATRGDAAMVKSADIVRIALVIFKRGDLLSMMFTSNSTLTDSRFTVLSLLSRYSVMQKAHSFYLGATWKR